MERPLKPDVFEYTDYRKYLQDLFTFKKAENKRFTYRVFSQLAGYTSPSILKEVIDGKKGIPPKSFRRFITPFKLSRKEEKFLEKLVAFNQAKTDEAKSRHFREIVKSLREPRTKDIAPAQYEFYNTWYNAVLREIIALKDFQNDPAWIARKISPRISPQQVKGALSLLLKLGLIKKHKQGRFVQDVPKLTVDPDITIQGVRELARRSIELEWEAIERFTPENREISGLTMHMSRSCYTDVKQMARKFKREVLDYVSRHPESSDVVCQLNLGLFPYISDMENGNGKK